MSVLSPAFINQHNIADVRKLKLTSKRMLAIKFFLIIYKEEAYYTFSENVSGFLGSKISLHVITVTRLSDSLRLMMLCVQPGIM